MNDNDNQNTTNSDTKTSAQGNTQSSTQPTTASITTNQISNKSPQKVPIFPTPDVSANNPQQPASDLLSKTSNKKPLKIVLLILLILAFSTGVFFAIQQLLPKSDIRTASQFEKIIKKLGYQKATNADLNVSDDTGSLTTYYIGNGDSTDGIVMFYDMKTKTQVKKLFEQYNLSIARISEGAFPDIDWTKDTNRYASCNQNKAHVTICIAYSHKKNTLLLSYYHSDSSQTAESEVNKVLNAMGY